MRYALGIDLGTGSTKAVLIDEAGDLVGRGQAEYPLYKPHPGWVEQDPEDWWQGLCASARQAIADIDPAQVACVGLSGQINGAVFVDSAGQPLQAGANLARPPLASRVRLGRAARGVTCCGNGR